VLKQLVLEYEWSPTYFDVLSKALGQHNHFKSMMSILDLEKLIYKIQLDMIQFHYPVKGCMVTGTTK
jgi:hypothetical protein